MNFYTLTGDPRYLARVPQAIDWLDKVKFTPELAQKFGRSHPTFIELGTDEPLYVHRRGSNVVNGEYYVDKNPDKTIGHYSASRSVNVAALRRRYEERWSRPVTGRRSSRPRPTPTSARARAHPTGRTPTPPTHVGDRYDTSPYNPESPPSGYPAVEAPLGISVQSFIRNMGTLIAYVAPVTSPD